MSLPLARRNGSAGFMDNNAELNMGLPTTGLLPGSMTNAQVIATPDQQLDAARTLFILCTLVSGTVTIKVDEFVPGTTHNFSSPVATLTLTNVTTQQYLPVDLTLANGLGFGIQFTAGAAGCQFKELLIFDANQMIQGEGWIDPGSAQNASAGALIANTLGTTVGSTTNTDQDGSGIVPRGPTAGHLFGG